MDPAEEHDLPPAVGRHGDPHLVFIQGVRSLQSVRLRRGPTSGCCGLESSEGRLREDAGEPLLSFQNRGLELDDEEVGMGVVRCIIRKSLGPDPNRIFDLDDHTAYVFGIYSVIFLTTVQFMYHIFSVCVIH